MMEEMKTLGDIRVHAIMANFDGRWHLCDEKDDLGSVIDEIEFKRFNDMYSRIDGPGNQIIITKFRQQLMDGSMAECEPWKPRL